MTELKPKIKINVDRASIPHPWWEITIAASSWQNGTFSTICNPIGFLNPDKTDEGDLSAHRRLFFGNYLDINAAEPSYVEIEDVEGLVQKISENLEVYNQESKTNTDR